ncbi:MAG TPA: glycosyltransferase family 1 protein [Thermomicrobiales bacterium]|nr:glycosyltransferase family 1 protein [Thermomicrobiales bacterium]
MTRKSGRPVIGIDGSRMGGDRRTGTENYSNQIVRGLVESDADWQWRLYLNSREAPDGIDDRVDIRAIPARRLWTHLRLSREMLIEKPDLLFVPSHVIPLVHAPSIVTIHDLGYLHVPEAHPASQRRMLDWTTRWSARVARHIIVPSSRTRDDLIAHYGTPEDRIDVVPHGVSPRFRSVTPEERRRVATAHRLDRPYVLAVGTIQPRKNLPALARALAEIGTDRDLVIAGKPGWMADPVLAELTAAGLGDRLRLLGYVPDADLPGLYAGADLFVQPSRFEGFGMPVIEAMAAGAPVLSATGSSLDEIAGTGARFFDPDDPSSLRDALIDLLGSEEARKRLASLGTEWSVRFTWEQATATTRSILERMLNS